MFQTQHLNLIIIFSSMFDETEHILLKGGQFFGDELRFRTLAQQYDSKASKKTDIQLQCLGHGYFQPTNIIKRFQRYLVEIFDSCPQMKSLKITFNGFNISSGKFIRTLNKALQSYRSGKLKTLWIHTSNLQGCTLDDFKTIVAIPFRFEQQISDQISLQMSIWSFEDENIPSLDNLKSIFHDQISNKTQGMSNMKYKKFRLQISGWFFYRWQALLFLGFALKDKDYEQIRKELLSNLTGVQLQKLPSEDEEKKIKIPPGLNKKWLQGYKQTDDNIETAVKNFHGEMFTLIKSLIDVLNDVEDFQIDIRNWNELLKMKDLKKRLDQNLGKKGKSEKSLISKKSFHAQKKDQEEKELRLNFVM